MGAQLQAIHTGDHQPEWLGDNQPTPSPAHPLPLSSTTIVTCDSTIWGAACVEPEQGLIP